MNNHSEIYCLDSKHGSNYSAYQADCVDFTSQMPSDSVDLSLYSPPFSDLFTYSDSVCDMGNSANDDEFMAHYLHLVRELFRVTRPGRLSCVHCIDLPSFKWKHGAVGLRDFPGEIIRAHVAEGWIYHSRVTIWKDPVVEMQRTKAVGLLHKTVKKDSAMCRVGSPDYLLVFRKDGPNASPIAHTAEEFPVDLWQQWASPVWHGIRQTKVLNREGAKGAQDEKHICPLQLDVIERCLGLWSNPGDTVFSPFMGIGSEGYQAVKFGRKFLGTELKPEYFRQAHAFLASIESESAALFNTLTP